MLANNAARDASRPQDGWRLPAPLMARYERDEVSLLAALDATGSSFPISPIQRLMDTRPSCPRIHRNDFT